MSHRHGDEVTATDARIHDDNMQSRSEVNRLRLALRKYTNCRHACQDCSCTMEARAALYVPDEPTKEPR